MDNQVIIALATPLKVKLTNLGASRNIMDWNNQLVATAIDEKSADAIVLAVNSHAALVAALKVVEIALFRHAEAGQVNEGRGHFIPTDTKQHPWIPGADAWPVVEVVRAAFKSAQGGDTNG